MTELRTEAFTAERTWEVEGVPVLTAEVALPEPDPLTDRISRRIHRYYQSQCRAFLRYCESLLLPQAAEEYREALASSGPLPEFRAELSYRVTYNQDGLWSLYTQSRERTGPGPALITRRSDTWDLTEGYPVPLGDFFPKGAGWRKRLISLAAEDIERRIRAGMGEYLPDWRQAVRRRFNPQNYYLTEEGLAFFYPMYALAPGSMGVPTFLTPYTEANPKRRGT